MARTKYSNKPRAGNPQHQARHFFPTKVLHKIDISEHENIDELKKGTKKVRKDIAKEKK